GLASALESTWCTSAANCWAVGHYATARTELNQALHWNGTRWSLVAIPHPGGTGPSDLRSLKDVTCATARHCWALGYFGTSGRPAHAHALRWDGRKRSAVPTPGPATASGPSGLNSVRCTSPANCWAVGWFSTSSAPILNQALHWNGTKWRRVAIPDPGGTGPR